MRKKQFALIGSGAVGKSVIARALHRSFPLDLVDIDELFRSRHGDIETYGKTKGWREFFAKEAEMVVGALLAEKALLRPSVIVLPASALYHSDYIDISRATLEVARTHAVLICILAHANHAKGAELSVERQLQRGYSLSPRHKRQQYLEQSRFYKRIADHLIVNDQSVEDAASELRTIIETHQPTSETRSSEQFRVPPTST